MSKKLQTKWGVNTLQLILIIATFAIGGSLCGYAGRKLLSLTSLDKGIHWIVLYIIIVTILWPLSVIIVSIPFGQFRFFKTYLKKIFAKLSGRPNTHNP